MLLTMIKSNHSKAGLSRISLIHTANQSSAENTQATLSNLLKCSQGLILFYISVENHQENNKNFQKKNFNYKG